MLCTIKIRRFLGGEDILSDPQLRQLVEDEDLVCEVRSRSWVSVQDSARLRHSVTVLHFGMMLCLNISTKMEFNMCVCVYCETVQIVRIFGRSQ